MDTIDDQRAMETGETPVNPYSLQGAVNEAAETAHVSWLVFIAVMAYLMIAVAGVTHKDLLLQTPVELPILQVQIPLVQFFQFAPILLLMFHVGVVSQIVLLARKTLEFDIAVRQLETSDRRTHPLRLELHNFFFVQAVAGPHRSIVMSAFLHGMSWLTLVILPVVLMLYIQISFLPYHDVVITWTHRIALLLEIGMLVLLGVFLTRAEPSFFHAFWRTTRQHPVTFVATSVVLLAVAFFSMFVATIPGERLDRITQAMARQPERQLASLQPAGLDSVFTGFALPFLTARADGSLWGLFHRNLIVTDTDLVSDKDVTAGEASMNLRGRDLRYARLDRSDLHQADMTGANLDGASLVGTDLRDVRLQCADVTQLILGEGREAARCASARGANLTKATLTGARMAGIDLRGAKLEEAHLDGAELTYGMLAGANFSSAHLDKADLSGGVAAQGANFLIASLQGADLTGAQLQYADFSSAAMQGASLPHASLEAAVLRDADLEGADLQKARLEGADLTSASLRAADLRGAVIWQTLPPEPEALRMADLTGVVLRPLQEADSVGLRTMLARLADPRLRRSVGEALKPALTDSISQQWGATPTHRTWVDLIANNRANPASGDGRQGLGQHLAELACRNRWSNGGVATGLARRAIGATYQADVALLHERLSRADCKAREGMPAKVLRDLATAADTLAARR